MNIELLAPAGNLEKLKIAIQYGADAVYIAGQQFGLRSAADNFSISDLEESIRFAHHHGKKIYLTLNAFLHDHELEGLPAFLELLNQLQPDAVICSDLGVIKTVRKYSEIPIHLSTQASVINSWSANIRKELGVKRIVVGREMTIDEASSLKQNSGLEVEMFIHGAMCMSYSGHCGISNYTAGRDSNRGGCIQNCRFNYKFYPEESEPFNAYFMSSRDLSGINRLKEFDHAGITSLKIEGRMKSNLYVASTVRAYYHAIQEYRETGISSTDKWEKELRKIPHRDYTEGSLISPAGVESVYDKQSETTCDYEMAGTVLDVDPAKRRFAFQIKNKMHAGNEIEVMPFRGDTVTIKIPKLINMSDREIAVAQPNNVIWLPWQESIEAKNVARTKKG